MRLVQLRSGIQLVGIVGEPSQPACCTERYIEPARWFFQARQEVEIWTLADGRQIRASRVRPTDEWMDWTLRWQSKEQQLKRLIQKGV
ncbi:hypothetical protein [Deinococcus sp. QL22]|uniref:hypothetical protein n=1 Tax=Deinococcus sp. QL22 TaxID=2939437 RepID=UPI002016B1A9|nr:hypothetical protein [Deinococcus sp. QL22]UQN05435.1 hypothetical protein M1R55_11175 [Deinococcus sp. QL22]